MRCSTGAHARQRGLVLSALLAILLTSLSADPVRAQVAPDSCLCNCRFDRDCAPGWVCDKQPEPLGGGTPGDGSCITNHLASTCRHGSGACDGVCAPAGGNAEAKCDAAVFPECDCNPRLNLNASGDNPDCSPGEVCVADGGCCADPGQCSSEVRTCNGRCVTTDDLGTSTAPTCGDGAVGGSEECDPGDAATGVPPVPCASGGCAAGEEPPGCVPCVNCACLDAGLCAPVE